MNLFFGKIISFLRFRNQHDRSLIRNVKKIVGKRPVNLELYRLASQHTSVARETSHGIKESNERLEYLGDAVLGTVVAEFLFKKFPYKDEGFLTDIRSRIVNRETLNQLARKIGIPEILQFNPTRKHAHSYKSIYGDTLEALVGAVFLDRGFKSARKFVLRRLLLTHLDLDDIVNNNPNYKSKIIEWAHKEKKDIKFEILEVNGGKYYREFIAQVYIDDEPISKGSGFTKKKAEQDAAEKSIDILKLD